MEFASPPQTSETRSANPCLYPPLANTLVPHHDGGGDRSGSARYVVQSQGECPPAGPCLSWVAIPRPHRRGCPGPTLLIPLAVAGGPGVRARRHGLAGVRRQVPSRPSHDRSLYLHGPIVLQVPLFVSDL
jgi:hypothetical protein